VLTQRGDSPDTDSRSDSAAQDTGIGTVPDTGGVPATDVRGEAGQSRWAQLPYAVVLAGMVGGLALMWLGSRQVKAGTVTVASALLVAAAARLVLPERRAGLLVSRRRLADVMVLVSLGTCLMLTALLLPSPS